ncbi:hypothetical protein NECID01_2034 [Nematocida sp. AWRm77]|nr:hypothetical protein NECID01_2034 [Nematocida sp. AWRm77]
MASLVNMRLACEQVSLPVCSVLFKGEAHARYPARAVALGPFNIYSPYTVMLLSLIVLMNCVLIKRTRKMYSFPARKEMLLFLQVYTGAVFLDLLLCCGAVRLSWGLAFTVVVSLQLGLCVASFASVMATGLVWLLPVHMSARCVVLSHMLTLGTFVFSSLSFALLIYVSFGYGVFVLLYPVPAFFSWLFSLTQLAKLKQLNSEIWSFGSILVAGALVAAIGLTPYVLGMVIVLISDRYLDGLFLIHLFAFFAVLKVYGLWTIDNEKEIEYVNTIKK